MELACTSPWKTVISIYKDLHTSGSVFRALCWKAPFPWNLQPHHHRGVCGLDCPEPKGEVPNKHCPTSASPGSCLPPGSGPRADPSSSVWTGLAGTSAFGPAGLSSPHQKGSLYAPGVSWFLDLKTWNFETDKTP